MRIVFLDSWHSSPVHGSGTTVAITSLARALEVEGHEVVRIRGLHGTDDGSTGLLPRLRYNVDLDRRIRRLAPDVAVGFDVDGCLLPDDRSYPVVVHLKGVTADEARFERGVSRLRLAFLSLLERRNARRADRLIVPSRYSREVARELYGIDEERIVVVPEGVDPRPWGRRRKRPPPDSGPGPVVLSVARQYPRKNTRTLIEAFVPVARRLPSARLRIVGGGPELARLRRQVVRVGMEGRIHLLGSLETAEQVREEYLAADCFCLPSLQEGFGIVFVEAMSAGLPVVAGRAGATPEVVRHDETGLLVDPRDPEALADALVRVLTDTALAERLGRSGTERARRFTPSRTALEFLEVVRDLPRPAQGPASQEASW